MAPKYFHEKRPKPRWKVGGKGREGGSRHRQYSITHRRQSKSPTRRSQIPWSSQIVPLHQISSDRPLLRATRSRFFVSTITMGRRTFILNSWTTVSSFFRRFLGLRMSVLKLKLPSTGAEETFTVRTLSIATDSACDCETSPFSHSASQNFTAKL